MQFWIQLILITGQFTWLLGNFTRGQNRERKREWWSVGWEGGGGRSGEERAYKQTFHVHRLSFPHCSTVLPRCLKLRIVLRCVERNLIARVATQVLLKFCCDAPLICIVPLCTHYSRTLGGKKQQISFPTLNIPVFSHSVSFHIFLAS